MFFKKLTVPTDNSTKQVEVVQTWEVRWRSRHGQYSGNTRDECEIFTNKDEAHSFAESLRNAFKLIRHVGSDTIKVEIGKEV